MADFNLSIKHPQKRAQLNLSSAILRAPCNCSIFNTKMLFVLVALFLWCLILYYGWSNNQYFKKKGINYLQPHLFVGNMLKVVLGKEHLRSVLTRAFYHKSDDKYVGFFNFMSPIVLIKDVDLIKQLLVKDFDHFTDHMKIIDEKSDPVLSKMLFFLEGEKWKEMRNAMSPAFTGSKMRTMFPFVKECAENFIKYLDAESRKPESLKLGYTEFEMKDLIVHYNSDVIASCAFGYKIDSLKNKNDLFFKMANTFNNPCLTEKLKLFIFFLIPSITRLFNLGMNEPGPKLFLKELTLNTIKTREASKIVRPDMIHLLILAKQGKLDYDIETENTISSNKINWTDDELVAQAIIFIAAGLDTVSTGLSYLIHELTINPDIQIKLQEEIDAFLLENDGRLEFTKMNNWKYLDMVISEGLRMWPSISYLDRVCVKPYTLPPQNDSTKSGLQINKGDTIWVSPYDIHRSPKYFENPDQFIPERFSDENKDSIHPYSYMPFGFGPRQCLGNRFVLMEMKIIIVYILANYNLIPTPNTDRQLKIESGYIEILPKGGFNIGFQKRERPVNLC